MSLTIAFLPTSFPGIDVTHSERNDDMSKHRLLFNISIPSYEEITMAELRLFTLLEERSAVRGAARATIKVYAVEHGGAGLTLRFLSGEDAEGSHHSWEAFDVTDTVRGWLRSGGGASELEVHVERTGGRAIRGGGLDISLSLKGSSSAALVVFSDDLGSRKKEAENELRDVMAHEEEGMFSDDLGSRKKEAENELRDVMAHEEEGMFSDDLGSRKKEAENELRDVMAHEEEGMFSDDLGSRKKEAENELRDVMAHEEEGMFSDDLGSRKKEAENELRDVMAHEEEGMFSDDLGSRKKEAENELRDVMAHEEEGMFSDDLGSRKKEAENELRDMMAHEEEGMFSDDLGSRKKEAENELRDVMAHEEEGMFSETDIQANGHHDGDIPPEVPAGIPADVRQRRRRQVRRDYCRRTSLRVNFKDIGWDKWIVAPMEYDAFECKGVCYFPLTDDLTPSKHAVIQTLVNLRYPKRANKACCVPTKLDPITVLYQEKDIITVRQMYEEMQVAACGCR